MDIKEVIVNWINTSIRSWDWVGVWLRSEIKQIAITERHYLKVIEKLRQSIQIPSNFQKYL